MRRELKKKQRENHIILTKYDDMHPTVVPGNNSSSGMLITLTKPEQFVFFKSEIFAGKVTTIVSKRIESLTTFQNDNNLKYSA